VPGGRCYVHPSSSGLGDLGSFSVANGKLSRAHVGLALASALVVLLASGVAISRISEGDNGSPVATGPSSTSSSLPGLGQPGPATSSGPASGPGTGGVAEQPAPMAGEADSEASAVVEGVTRTGRKATGKPSASTSDASAAAAGAPGGPGSGAPARSGAAGGGAQGGGQESPPAPSQVPPDEMPLATAAVSAGEGAQGAVVGIGLGNEKPAEADVTVGTNPLVGDHPPSEGTGVTFGGRLLKPPPSLPILPG
jgi:hypothetical protein